MEMPAILADSRRSAAASLIPQLITIAAISSSTSWMSKREKFRAGQARGKSHFSLMLEHKAFNSPHARGRFTSWRRKKALDASFRPNGFYKISGIKNSCEFLVLSFELSKRRAEVSEIIVSFG